MSVAASSTAGSERAERSSTPSRAGARRGSLHTCCARRPNGARKGFEPAPGQGDVARAAGGFDPAQDALDDRGPDAVVVTAGREQHDQPLHADEGRLRPRHRRLAEQARQQARRQEARLDLAGLLLGGLGQRQAAERQILASHGLGECSGQSARQSGKANRFRRHHIPLRFDVRAVPSGGPGGQVSEVAATGPQDQAPTIKVEPSVSLARRRTIAQGPLTSPRLVRLSRSLFP